MKGVDVAERMAQLLAARNDLDAAGERWRSLFAEVEADLAAAEGATVPIPGFGNASVHRPPPRFRVDDPAKLHGWVAIRYPEGLEITVRVRSALLDALVAQGSVLSEDGRTGQLVDPSGDLVPGVTVELAAPALHFAEGPVEGDGLGEPDDDQDPPPSAETGAVPASK